MNKSSAVVDTGHNVLCSKWNIKNPSVYNPEKLTAWFLQNKSITIDFNHLNNNFAGKAQECWDWMVNEYEKDVFSRQVQSCDSDTKLMGQDVKSSRKELSPDVINHQLQEKDPLKRTFDDQFVKTNFGGDYNKFFSKLIFVYDQSITAEHMKKGRFVKYPHYVNIIKAAALASILCALASNYYDIQSYLYSRTMATAISELGTTLLLALWQVMKYFVTIAGCASTVAFIISCFDSTFFRYQPKATTV